MRSGWASLASLAAAAAVLVACDSGGRSNVPLACPTPTIPADASELTRYRPGVIQDLTTLVFDARLSGLQGGCRARRRNEGVDLVVTALFTVERGAAAEGRSVTLPWMVAVVDGRTDEPLGPPEPYRSTIVFGRNEARVSGNSQAITVPLPLTAERRIQDYKVLVFFQLTPEELALNRRRGPR